MSEFTETEEFLRERLRLLRRNMELTQEAVAELAGISSIYYQSIEAGRRPNVSLKIIHKISQVYGLAIHELFSPQVPNVKIKKIPQAPHRPRQR